MSMWLYATLVIIGVLFGIMLFGSAWLLIAQALGPDWGALFKIVTVVVGLPAIMYVAFDGE